VKLKTEDMVAVQGERQAVSMRQGHEGGDNRSFSLKT